MSDEGQEHEQERERELEHQEQEQQSLARIEAGGIPLSAERRLSELREHGGSFTSDLSVSAFALCHRLGLTPVAQVMGSSIYQVGYQSSTWPMMMGGSVLTELDTLSDAWNEVRRRALNRLSWRLGTRGRTQWWACSCARARTTGRRERSSTRCSGRRCGALAHGQTSSRR